MKIEVIETTDEFIVLEITSEGLPTRRTSIHIDAIAEGKTTLEEQISICEEDCKKREQRIKAMNKALKAMEKL